jgi:hypothetical protein
MWAIEPTVEATDRQSAMESEVGPALLQLAEWVGLRASEGDRKSIAILADHIIMILQTGKEIIEKDVADYRNN